MLHKMHEAAREALRDMERSRDRWKDHANHYAQKADQHLAHVMREQKRYRELELRFVKKSDEVRETLGWRFFKHLVAFAIGITIGYYTAINLLN